MSAECISEPCIINFANSVSQENQDTLDPSETFGAGEIPG